jgi:polar amino acid transport system substrate-binding protein
MKIAIYLPVVLAILILPVSVFAQKINVYTEEFPPYNYTDGGKVVGASTEVVEQVLQNCGYDYSITSYPWARSYQLVQRNENSLIYSIGRRKKRETLFKWIGEITPITQSVYALRTRTDIKITNLDDLKKYKLGTTVEDARETWLLHNGFKLENLDRTSGKYAHSRNFKKLQTGRIDLWPMPDSVAYFIVKQEGFDPETILKRVFPLTELSTVNYMAASLQTADEIVIKLSTELSKFKKTDEYKQILDKWDLSISGMQD